jgi:hypothetical protein
MMFDSKISFPLQSLHQQVLHLLPHWIAEGQRLGGVRDHRPVEAQQRQVHLPPSPVWSSGTVFTTPHFNHILQIGPTS